MIPEAEIPQEAKSVCPDQATLIVQADLGRYITQSSSCWFSRGTTHVQCFMGRMIATRLTVVVSFTIVLYAKLFAFDPNYTDLA